MNELMLSDCCNNLINYKVVEEKKAALKIVADDVFHHYNGKMQVWIPKAALKEYLPGDEVLKDCFKLESWFLKKLNNYQAKALGRLI